MNKIFATLSLVLALMITPAVAHDPAPDMGKGKMVQISGWCKKVDDATVLTKAIHRQDQAAVMKMYMASDPAVGGSSCHSVFVMRQITRAQLPMPTVELLHVSSEISAPDGRVTAIVAVKNASGNTVYTWHTFRPTGA